MSPTLPLLASCLIAGCAIDVADSTESAETTEYTDEPRISPNGVSLTALRVPTAAGVTVAGIAPVGISAAGASIGIAATGAPLAGSAIVGSRWTGHLSDGGTLTLRLDAAIQGVAPNDDVWSYRVSALSGSTWVPACVDAAGVAALAESVRGTWSFAQGVACGGAYHGSASDFTIACRGSAVSKCIEFGFKPWNGLTLDLVACTRAMRADFCGDGRAYTVDGTMVNIFDVSGILPDGVAWAPEAEWTPNGASCVSSAAGTRFSQTVQQTPSCYPTTLPANTSCGSGQLGRIITELPPR